MEEAQGYHALANEFKRSQDEIAKIVGKSRSHVANMMRLTKLPAEVQAYIASGQLSAGHARALIGVPDPAAAAKRIVEEGLNVRQAEALAHVEGVPVAQAAKGARRQGERPRYGRAGEAGQRCPWAGGQRRSSRSRRHRAHPLPRSRSARRDRASRLGGRARDRAAPCHSFALARKVARRGTTPPPRSGRGRRPHPRRFAFTAIDSSTRCAMTAASGACLRISSAAVAS